MALRWRWLWALAGLVGGWAFLGWHPPRVTVAAGRPLVVLDPGHGGIDPGAVGAGGVLEKTVNWEVTVAAARVLGRRGVAVVLTRQGDTTAAPGPYLVVRDLRYRAFLARHRGATLLVSIHSNAEPSGRAVGPIVYYYAPSLASRALADALTAPLTAVTGIYHAPRPARHLVLVEAGVPAVTVELGFLTAAADRARLTSPTWQARLGAAVAQGILRYLAERGG
ncbi:MAG: N-acetylmuramoyl-L-alanine amidase [Firmicutes bacterium]|nr:N-acetylmuramoyl-L-alanine amidase [Alicyclobacillaceae bacterium]MCL6497933.1 N-acetylmuramoyl-L-alanine amidase [Bacillota bacterium]